MLCCSQAGWSDSALKTAETNPHAERPIRRGSGASTLQQPHPPLRSPEPAAATPQQTGRCGWRSKCKHSVRGQCDPGAYAVFQASTGSAATLQTAAQQPGVQSTDSSRRVRQHSGRLGPMQSERDSMLSQSNSSCPSAALSPPQELLVVGQLDDQRHLEGVLSWQVLSGAGVECNGPDEASQQQPPNSNSSSKTARHPKLPLGQPNTGRRPPAATL